MTEQEFIAAVLGFQSREPARLLQPDLYHLNELADQVRSAFSDPHLDEGLAARLRGAIVDGLARLDALPRDDPFWAGWTGPGRPRPRSSPGPVRGMTPRRPSSSS